MRRNNAVMFPPETLFHHEAIMNIARKISLLLAATLFVPCLALAAASADKAPKAAKAASGEKMIQVALGSNALSGKIWRYTAGGNGAVSEASFEEYAAWQQGSMKPAANGTIQIPDGPIPGTTVFVFKGKKPGMVELRFAYADKDNPKAKPERMAVYRIKIHPDKTLTVVESSEKNVE